MTTDYNININNPINSTLSIGEMNLYKSKSLFQASFTVKLNRARTKTCSVNYSCVDDSALNWIDYIGYNGTVTFLPGSTSQVINVPILSSTTSKLSKQFKIILSNPINCQLSSLSTSYTGVCAISTPPTYSSVPFPGSRMALIGDSITSLNTHHNPPQYIKNALGGTLYNPYFDLHLFSCSGYFAWANSLMNDGNTPTVGNPFTPNPLSAYRFEMETAIQPNVDAPITPFVVPVGARIQNGSISTGQNIGWNVPSNENCGYNFGVAGSMVANWMFKSDQTLIGAVSRQNISPDTPYTLPAVLGGASVSGYQVEVSPAIFNKGPVYAALENINKFDCLTMMGGINDLSGNADPAVVLNTLISYAYMFAMQGKWVFIITITPRTTMAPDSLPSYEQGLKGYSRNAQIQIQLNAKIVNQGLRDWYASNPPNIFLVDVENDLLGPNTIDLTGKGLVGPYSAVMTGQVALDPFGWISPATIIGDVSTTEVCTPGNWNPLYPGEIAAMDGLHPTTTGAEIIGRKLAKAWTDAGVYNRVSNTTLGPLSFGANLIRNPTFNVTTTYPSANPPGLGFSNKLGRAKGLGPRLTDSTHTGGGDTYSNYGLGYTYGPVPDYWFVYKCDNTENDYAQSNFNAYGFGGYLTDNPTNIPSATLSPFLVDPSPWTDGCLVTSIVTAPNGLPGYKLIFNVPQNSNGGNMSFVVRASLPGGPGQWSNYTTDTGLSYSAPAGPPNTYFSPGDVLTGESELYVSGLSNNLFAMHMNLSIGQYTQTGQSLQSLGLYENFWPINGINYMKHHAISKNLLLHSPAVVVPALYATQNANYMNLDFCFSLDTRNGPGTMTAIISNPSVRKIISGVSSL